MNDRQLQELSNSSDNLKIENEIRLENAQICLNENEIARQRDSLILFLSAQLNGYEWVKLHFPEYYVHCEKVI